MFRPLSARWSRPCLAACMCFVVSALLVASLRAEPPKPPLTSEQQEKLKERDRHVTEANRLQREGKLAEAIAAAEKMLAIERQVFGKEHDGVIDSLQFLASLHQQKDDWAAARRSLQEVLDVQTQRYGKEDWRVTDARWRWPLRTLLRRRPRATAGTRAGVATE